MIEYTIRGLKLRVNPVFFALFPAAAVLGLRQELLILLLSAFLHELAHMMAGILTGLRPERLEVTALGLSAGLPGMELLPASKKYAVYLSGPAASLLAALTASRLGYDFIFLVNAAFTAFNLLPARTLDGGRVLGAFLTRRIGFIGASRVLTKVNLVVCVFLMAIGIAQVILFPPNLSLFLLGFILLWQGKKVVVAECLRFTSDILDQNGKYANGRRLCVRHAAFPADAPAKALLDYLDYDTIAIFYIYNRTGRTTIITESNLINITREHGINGDISEMLSRCPI
ncbi:MAG: site-2 protease family protein [Defluviitaleaceae bacterium]|nr:site-2 protease family protein [Defluviitaleaceae bacterium]MCL2836135.1 site-2 protease family protein [Defluviitaleaceae bacterium]